MSLGYCSFSQGVCHYEAALQCKAQDEKGLLDTEWETVQLEVKVLVLSLAVVKLELETVTLRLWVTCQDVILLEIGPRQV